MATMLEECTDEEERSVVRFFFLWAKGLTAKDIRKEMFPVYGGKILSHKTVHNWVTNVSLMTKRLKRICAEVAEATVKRLLCCGFRSYPCNRP
jgi:hypothetical protein